MNNVLVVNSIRFIALVLIQVSIFNNLNFLGYINPLPYILFLLALPFNTDKSLALVWAFLLGLVLDLFGTSGGIHTTACLIATYLRPLLLRFSFGISFEYHALKLSDVPFNQRLTYVLLFIGCLLYTSPSPRDQRGSRMPSSA